MSIAVRSMCGTSRTTFIAALLHPLILYNYILLQQKILTGRLRRVNSSESFFLQRVFVPKFPCQSLNFCHVSSPINLLRNSKLSRSFWSFTSSLLDPDLPQHCFWYEMNICRSESMHGAARQSIRSRIILNLALVWNFLWQLQKYWYIILTFTWAHLFRTSMTSIETFTVAITDCISVKKTYHECFLGAVTGCDGGKALLKDEIKHMVWRCETLQGWTLIVFNISLSKDKVKKCQKFDNT